LGATSWGSWSSTFGSARCSISSHALRSSQLTPWVDGEHVIGYCREVANARAIWFDDAWEMPVRRQTGTMRCIACPRRTRSTYWSSRVRSAGGAPLLGVDEPRGSEAYRLLRARNPRTPVCVLGESAAAARPARWRARPRPRTRSCWSFLSTPWETSPPGISPFLPVRLNAARPVGQWGSVAVLCRAVQIFGAIDDEIIPINHAKALASHCPKLSSPPSRAATTTGRTTASADRTIEGRSKSAPFYAIRSWGNPKVPGFGSAFRVADSEGPFAFIRADG